MDTQRSTQRTADARLVRAALRAAPTAAALLAFAAGAWTWAAPPARRPATAPAATAATTAPAPGGDGDGDGGDVELVDLEDGPLRVVVTAVDGKVQAKPPGASAKWQAVTEGMELAEGWELRTLPKSRVEFRIPPTQTFVLDRVSRLTILRAAFQDGKIVTDVGLLHGRTGYEIEGGGRENDSRIRSPNSTLAVRGTVVTLYDQPPFAPQAQSLTGVAQFQDAKKRIAFGSRGGGARARVRSDKSSAADVALSSAVVDPSIARARSEAESQLIADLISRGAISFFDPIRGIDVIQGGEVPTTQELRDRLPGLVIAVRWAGDANLDIAVSEVGRDTYLAPVAAFSTNPNNRGRIAFDHRGGPNGGFEYATFDPLRGGLRDDGGRVYNISVLNVSPPDDGLDHTATNVTFFAFGDVEKGVPVLLPRSDLAPIEPRQPERVFGVDFAGAPVPILPGQAGGVLVPTGDTGFFFDADPTDPELPEFPPELPPELPPEFATTSAGRAQPAAARPFEGPLPMPAKDKGKAGKVGKAKHRPPKAAKVSKAAKVPDGARGLGNRMTFTRVNVDGRARVQPKSR